MKRLKSIENKQVQLEIGECDCGYHFGIDATFLDQVKDFVFGCPSCGRTIDTSELFHEDGAPEKCECDNTHEANGTVCRWCHAHGRRHWNDPEVCDKCGGPLTDFEDITAYGKDVRWCKKCCEGLTPPDLKQCQAEVLEGSFMTLGPRSVVRCKNAPVYIAQEKKPGKDGKRGSMSLCFECAKVLKLKMGDNYATFRTI